MMISRRLLGLAVIAALLLTACGKKAPAYTKYIPKDAGNVISIDVRSLVGKLEKDSLSIEEMMAAFKDTANPDQYTKSIGMYKDFKDAGIDWSSKLYLSVGSVSSANAMKIGASFSLQLVAGMKDAAKFEAFLKKQPQTKEIKKGEGYSFTSDNNYAIGWNDDAVMIVGGYEQPAMAVDEAGDSAEMSRPKSETVASAPVEKLKKYFKLDKKESILSVEGFNDVQSKKSDIAIFSQVNLDGINAMAFAFVPKLKDLIEGAYSYSTINFEDGKAVLESSSFTGKQLGDVLKKYAGPEVDMGLIDNYPSQNVDGSVLFSFKPELVPALIRESGLDALLGLGLAQTGMTLDDFGKIFKGDFAVVFSDFAVGKKDMGKDAFVPTSIMPTAKMIFTAKIGDKAVFDKLVSLAESRSMLVRRGNMIIPMENGVAVSGSPFAISTANDMLTFASDSALLVAYQAKSQKIGMESDIRSKLKGNSIAAFFDIQKILNGISPSLFDSADVMAMNMVNHSKATFKDAWFTTGNFNGKSINGTGELIFADGKRNSLGQLVRFITYASNEMKADKARRIAHQGDPVTFDGVTLEEVPRPKDSLTTH